MVLITDHSLKWLKNHSIDSRHKFHCGRKSNFEQLSAIFVPDVARYDRRTNDVSLLESSILTHTST